jgi:hypothetical protein
MLLWCGRIPCVNTYKWTKIDFTVSSLFYYPYLGFAFWGRTAESFFSDINNDIDQNGSAIYPVAD